MEVLEKTKTANLSDAKAVTEFLRRGNTVVPTSEVMTFWKACTLEERATFGNEARALLAQ